jgi:hypothetical protein
MYNPSPFLLRSFSMISLGDNSLKFKVKNNKTQLSSKYNVLYLLNAPQGSRNALINCDTVLMFQISQCHHSPDGSPEASQCYI